MPIIQPRRPLTTGSPTPPAVQNPVRGASFVAQAEPPPTYGGCVISAASRAERPIPAAEPVVTGPDGRRPQRRRRKPAG
jgi:hypothetical protein